MVMSLQAVAKARRKRVQRIARFIDGLEREGPIPTALKAIAC